MRNLWKTSGIIIATCLIIFTYWNTSAEFHKTLSSGNNSRTHSLNNAASVKFFMEYITRLYEQAGLDSTGLDKQVFTKAITGYYNLKNANRLSANKSIITIIDYTKPSTEKRLWIIDLHAKTLLFHTLVAHGQESGIDKAIRFSNRMNSHESSLGFYITGNTYIGNDGLSLKLDGIDAGYNTNARLRNIVVHGAAYVSRQFIDEFGRLGRSFGCPAVPLSVANDIINTIKNKTLLFINGNNSRYTSHYLNKQKATNFLLSEISSNNSSNEQS